MVTPTAVADLWQLLEKIPDPEIPEINVVDLGIVRDLSLRDGGCVAVLTPTYSGCPAYDTIERDIRSTLEAAGLSPVTVEKRYSPPWSSDWLSPRARATLRDIGIAPPPAAGEGAQLSGAGAAAQLSGAGAAAQLSGAGVAAQLSGAGVAAPLHFYRRAVCPRCRSQNTERISFFGATACKAQHRCLDCLEPFEEFKAI